MKNNSPQLGRLFRLFPAFLVAVVSLPFFTLAETTPPPLRSGMESSEVLTLWGPPSVKSEREVRRIDEWSYPHGSVTLKDGKVLAWNHDKYQGGTGELQGPVEDSEGGASASSVQSLRGSSRNIAPKALNSSKNTRPKNSKDLLSEILEDLPSDDSGISSAPGAPGPGIPPARPGQPQYPTASMHKAEN